MGILLPYSLLTTSKERSLRAVELEGRPSTAAINAGSGLQLKFMAPDIPYSKCPSTPNTGVLVAKSRLD